MKTWTLAEYIHLQSDNDAVLVRLFDSCGGELALHHKLNQLYTQVQRLSTLPQFDGVDHHLLLAVIAAAHVQCVLADWRRENPVPTE